MKHNNAELKSITHNGTEVQTWIHNGTEVWSSGHIVNYIIDTGVSYQEKIKKGQSCLSPATFNPAKSGWTFAGWREDTTASSSVLSSKVMGNSSITLYAVFKQVVTVTYYNNGSTASSAAGYKYYNNGNTVNPAFTIAQATRSGWTARGWSTSAAGNGSIAYNAISNTVISANVTLYGMYQQTITVTYYNGSTTASAASGIRYYNSNGSVVNPSFTLTQTTISGWTTRGWSTSTSGNGAITYSSGAAFARDSNITLYGMYQQSITLSYNGNGSTSGSTSSQTGTRYYNSNGNYVNPTFALAANGFARTGATFKSWALGGTSGTQYAVGTSITLSASTVVYAIWTGVSQTITINSKALYPNYMCSWDTQINLPSLTYYLLCDNAIDCSLYSGIKVTTTQVYANTQHEGTGAILGIYESGGNFLPILTFYKEWVSVGGKQVSSLHVADGSSATLTFAKSSGTIYLYIGFKEYYGNKGYVYTNPLCWLKSIELLPR